MVHQRPFPQRTIRPSFEEYKQSLSPAPPLGELVDTIEAGDLKPLSDGVHKIADVDFVASYNWASGESPEIIIPGMPPRWTPLETPIKLSPDSGKYYLDPNAASYPSHPLEPAVIAMMEMHPNPLAVDIFACSSTLGNLFRFASSSDYRPFRMIVEAIGDTVHLVRRENSPTDLIPQVKGFGHTFPEAFTTWDKDVTGSKSHQRIIKYKFASLQFLVRFEGDGFIDDEAKERYGLHPTNGNVERDFQVQFADLKVTTRSTEPNRPDTLQVVSGGDRVSQTQIFDLKTRMIRSKGEDILGEQLHRLWITQVKNFILAFHSWGKFQLVEVSDVSNDVLTWEQTHQAALGKFAALLERILLQARESSGNALEVMCSTQGVIEVRKRLPGVGELLSPNIRRRYENWTDGSGGALQAESDKEDLLSNAGAWSDSDSGGPGEDLTACHAECGYCGKCASWTGKMATPVEKSKKEMLSN